ncbi:MAG: hypothetical protein WAN69_14385, partial [Candidatus Korobacteraceae bacterium]
MAKKKHTKKPQPRADQRKTSPAAGTKPVVATTRSAEKAAPPSVRTYSIPDYRLEHPQFRVYQSGEGSSVEYKVEGDLSAPAPPIRDSKYLTREPCIAIYRWMLLNRRMEAVLENLYKQSLVVGGVYFGLGQEGCSCASAFALRDEDWLAPMIRN